jgi:hypothetical protein
MAQKDFYIQIGDDRVHLHRINVDAETGIAEIEAEENMNNILSSSPVVIDVTHLDYVPYIDSVWDGENFIDEQGRERFATKQHIENPKRFSFTVDGKHKLYMVMAENENSAMKIAALLSNPVIVSEIK